MTSVTRPINIRVTGGILDTEYESFISKIAVIVGEYDLALEENIL